MQPLSKYEIQVLIGTCISGCRMPPDETFDLKCAWSALYEKGLIDRTDGLAIVTRDGQRVIDAVQGAAAAVLLELEGALE